MDLLRFVLRAGLSHPSPGVAKKRKRARVERRKGGGAPGQLPVQTGGQVWGQSDTRQVISEFATQIRADLRASPHGRCRETDHSPLVGIAMDDSELASLIQLAEVIRIKLEQERSENLPLAAPEDVAAVADGRRKPVLRDKTTGGRYRVPSNMTHASRKIYRALNIERSLTPTAP